MGTLILACGLGGVSALGCGEAATSAGRPPRSANGAAEGNANEAREGSASPGSNASKRKRKGKPAVVGTVMKGIASYYADSLAGRPTASGELYDPKELTAAHRTLPFGTLVEVTREDGRTVVVRINDRGPFGSKKRILDLSRRAAEEVGLIRAGVAPVTAKVIGRE